MPKPDKRKSRVPDSDSDSGPDDRGPAPKKPAGTSSGGGGGGGGSAARPKGNPSVEGQEPTWELGKMKKVKVSERRDL